MAIYGTALLSFCVLVGLIVGELLGRVLQVEANVGGVGIAMVLLMGLREWLGRKGIFDAPAESGVGFWCAIYIPVVVAIAATQNVKAALHAGPAALLAGATAVFLCFAMVPWIARFGPLPEESEKDEGGK